LFSYRKANIGAGVVIARDGELLTLVTAAHVVRSGSPLRILDTSRRSYYVVIDVRTVPNSDLALIRVRTQPDFPVAPVTFGRPTPGEPVWVWGNPANEFWSLSIGNVQSVDVELPGESGARPIAITCETCGNGDSGSGVFATDGKLLGIVTASWKRPDGVVAFVEVQPVNPILLAVPLANR
jgi:serine protease Do